jgi:hypothetical protein
MVLIVQKYWRILCPHMIIAKHNNHCSYTIEFKRKWILLTNGFLNRRVEIGGSICSIRTLKYKEFSEIQIPSSNFFDKKRPEIY